MSADRETPKGRPEAPKLLLRSILSAMLWGVWLMFAHLFSPRHFAFQVYVFLFAIVAGFRFASQTDLWGDRILLWLLYADDLYSRLVTLLRPGGSDTLAQSPFAPIAAPLSVGEAAIWTITVVIVTAWAVARKWNTMSWPNLVSHPFSPVTFALCCAWISMCVFAVERLPVVEKLTVFARVGIKSALVPLALGLLALGLAVLIFAYRRAITAALSPVGVALAARGSSLAPLLRPLRIWLRRPRSRTRILTEIAICALLPPIAALAVHLWMSAPARAALSADQRIVAGHFTPPKRHASLAGAHAGAVTTIDVADDIGRIATGGLDGMVRLWSDRGRLIATAPSAYPGVQQVVFIEDPDTSETLLAVLARVPVFGGEPAMEPSYIPENQPGPLPTPGQQVSRPSPMEPAEPAVTEEKRLRYVGDAGFDSVWFGLTLDDLEPAVLEGEGSALSARELEIVFKGIGEFGAIIAEEFPWPAHAWGDDLVYSDESGDIFLVPNSHDRDETLASLSLPLPPRMLRMGPGGEAVVLYADGRGTILQPLSEGSDRLGDPRALLPIESSGGMAVLNLAQIEPRARFPLDATQSPIEVQGIAVQGISVYEDVSLTSLTDFGVVMRNADGDLFSMSLDRSPLDMPQPLKAPMRATALAQMQRYSRDPGFAAGEDGTLLAIHPRDEIAEPAVTANEALSAVAASGSNEVYAVRASDGQLLFWSATAFRERSQAAPVDLGNSRIPLALTPLGERHSMAVLVGNGQDASLLILQGTEIVGDYTIGTTTGLAEDSRNNSQIVDYLEERIGRNNRLTTMVPLGGGRLALSLGGTLWLLTLPDTPDPGAAAMLTEIATTGDIQALAYHPEANLLFAMNISGAIEIYRELSGQRFQRVASRNAPLPTRAGWPRGGFNPVGDLAISGDRLVVVGEGHGVLVYDLIDIANAIGNSRSELTAGNIACGNCLAAAFVSGVYTDEGGAQRHMDFFTIDGQGLLRRWRTGEEGELDAGFDLGRPPIFVRRLGAQDSALYAAAFSDRSVEIVNTVTGTRPYAPIRGFHGRPTAIAGTTDGTLLAVGTSLGEVHVFQPGQSDHAARYDIIYHMFDTPVTAAPD